MGGDAHVAPRNSRCAPFLLHCNVIGRRMKKQMTALCRQASPVMMGAAFVAFTAFSALADIGHASFYGRELAGRRTASGEVFRPEGMTAAHRSLPMGTRLKVTNLGNGKSVVLRINDRGPFVRGRLIDVSQGAARQLGFVAQGTARVRIERMGSATPPPAPMTASASEPAVEPEPALPEITAGPKPEGAGQ